MTTQKYKVGDEVLVRARIRHAFVDSEEVFLCDFPDSKWIRFHIKDIYSLAPEFNYGEEIEVSDDHVNWYAEAKFISHNFDSHLPFIIKIDGKNLAYRYARKIQPKQEENILMFEGKKYKLVEE